MNKNKCIINTNFPCGAHTHSPEGHDVSVGTKAGQTNASVYLYHICPQHKGRFGDVVFESAGLGG